MSPLAALAFFAVTLTYDQARARLAEVSDALAGAKSNVESKSALAAATHHLRQPEVSIDVREQRFEKTLDLPLGSLAPVAAQFGIHGPLRFRLADWRVRPELSVSLPLYTGGQIGAVQAAATFVTQQAEAERETTAQSLDVQLVNAYFGQQLSARALAVREEVLAGLDHHVKDALALEREGFATKAQRLQAQVARDQAARELEKAKNDYSTASSHLANLLHSDSQVITSTPLFIDGGNLESVEAFQRVALASHPQVGRLRAGIEQAKQGVRIAQAALKPQAFAFGAYDLYRSDAAPGDADWAFGAGLRYAILSSNGRRERIASAKDQQESIEASLRELESQLRIGVIRAYDDLETAQRQYALLESSTENAEENLRLQTVSFHEGFGTSLDVIDAQLALAQTRIERAHAAWQFDVALIRLLEVSGQTGRFAEYISRADGVLDHE